MTMARGTAVTPPSPYPADQNHSHPMYGFQSDQWDDPPTEFDYETIPSEVLMRRNAHDFAYKQRDNYFNWNRYVMLGYFTFESCFDFDKLWLKKDENPLQVHRAIWYNFMYHVDRDLPVPSKLNAWATNISHPYLVFYDPTTLNETDTNTTQWKDMHFMKAMEIDDPANDEAWIPVQNRRRSKSPPVGQYDNNLGLQNRNASSDNKEGSIKLPSNYRPLTHLKEKDSTLVQDEPISIRPREQSTTQEINRPVKVNATEEISMESSHAGSHSNANNTFETSDRKKTPTPIATNDGTHRITIKWTPPKDLSIYENDKSQLNEAIYALVKAMLPDELGYLYRWESVDMQVFKTPTQIDSNELRDFISPHITFIPSHSRMVFGIRYGFKDTASMWRHSPAMKEMYQSQKKVDVVISNSKSTSGNLTTVGYILFKSPNTTHIARYTQYLRSILPETTPFFDIIRNRKSPMDQPIPHLAVQCGDKHVTPLCQALLGVLNGRKSALFLPRYAFSTMEEEKVKSHFTFHHQWTKSLVAIPLSPQINHLDLDRKEYNTDGSITVRSCRAWAASLTLSDETTPALCDVVNGTKNQKTYMIMPRHFLESAHHHLRNYKSRLHPPSHREARFRDAIQGLPDIITIQTEVQSNLNFLDQLSSTDIWRNAPTAVRTETRDADLPTETSTPTQNTRDTNWPILPATNSSRRSSTSTRRGKRTQEAYPQQAQVIDEDDATGEERSSASTKSLTYGSQTTTHPRFQELETLLKNQQAVIDEVGRKTSDRLTLLEKQFNRIDDLDTKMASIQSRLAESNHQMDQKLNTLQNETTSQFKEMKGSVITTMESQHKMSGTLLDMREQFDKMSTFIVDLAEKMETAMHHVSRTPPEYATQPHTTGMRASSASKRAKDTTSQNSESSQSTFSQASSQDSSVYRSPEKKKLRPRGYQNHLATSSVLNSDNDERMTMTPTSSRLEQYQLDVEQENDMDHLSETSDVCLNLDETLQRVQKPHAPPPVPTLAPLFVRKPLSQRQTKASQQKAPLDSQYTTRTDPAGAPPP